MNGVVVREIAERDLPQFYRALEALTDVGLSCAEGKRILRKIGKNSRQEKIFVAVKDGRVVGTATILMEQKFIHEGCVIAHIEDVAVRKEEEGKGIGSLLVSKLVETAKRAGCYRCILDCSDSVVPFYEKLGFRKHGNEMRLEIHSSHD